MHTGHVKFQDATHCEAGVSKKRSKIYVLTKVVLPRKRSKIYVLTTKLTFPRKRSRICVLVSEQTTANSGQEISFGTIYIQNSK